MRLFGAGALAPLLLGLAVAQKDQPPTFQSGIDLVTSAVVVHDAQGHAAGNLRAEDFAIFDRASCRKSRSSAAGAPEYLYLIGFAPEKLKLDGNFHALKVELKNQPALKIESARKGYYAVKPK